MPPTQQDDGSEDVADFLERIRELGERTKTGEAERSRKLDEEILQGKREREARRAGSQSTSWLAAQANISTERARSISPTKDSPVTTPSRQTAQSSMAGTPASMLGSRPTSTIAEQDQRKSVESVSSDKPVPKTSTLNLDSEPFIPNPPAGNTLSRSGTLSWQQRPSSKVESRGSTPLLSLDDKTTLNPHGMGTGSPEPSRADVASALGKKDPSWFRQTADRGASSAAYRRSQEEPVGQVSGHVQLPGMGHRTPDNTVSSTKDILGSAKQGLASASAASLASSSINDLTSPTLSFPKAKLNTPTGSLSNETQSASIGLVASPSQRHISPERPVSPTKGLGGFVQSAMLKRSDSLNKHKRAGSQVASSLSRGNSVVNSQGSTVDGASDSLQTSTRNSRDSFERGRQSEAPLSPSKTLDARRWSPTKQSWLEGAISKTDSPRPKSTSIQTPPLWLSDLQKSKESSSSSAAAAKTVSSQPGSSQNDSRQPIQAASRVPETSEALGTRSAGLSNSSTWNQTFTAGEAPNKASGNVDKLSDTTTESKPSVSDNQAVPSETDAAGSKSIPPIVKSPKPDTYKSTSVASETIKPTSKTSDSGDNRSPVPEQKPKPNLPPKKDFRAGLRSTRDLDQKPKTDELEFKNVFGKLKKTETKNYVAPDELKDNILRGKTALNVTGGPRVYQKRDDFKDSILKKKEEMKAGVSSKAKAPEPVEAQPVPEAIARRQKLGSKPGTEHPADPTKAAVETKQERSQTKTSFSSSMGMANASAKPPVSAKPDAIRKVSLDAEPSQSKVINTSPMSPSRTKHSMTQVEEPRLIPLEKKTSAPAQLQTTAASNTFANRFNPGLASILARGPPQMASNISASPRTASPTRIEDDHPTSKGSTETSSKQLSHATKGRAKGPKRRAPGNPSVESAKKSPAVVVQSSPSSQKKSFTPVTSSILTVPHKLETKTGFLGQSIEGTSNENEEAATKQLPVIAAKPVAISGLTPASMQKNGDSVKPGILDTKAPIQKNSNSDNTISPPPKSPLLVQKSPKHPPTPGDKAKAMSRIVSNGTTTDRLETPVPGGILNNFFDNLSTMQNHTDFDAQALLQSPEPIHNERSRTVKKDMYEISSDGRKSALAPRQEYVLFEDKMYLCRHHFENSDGRQNVEVFLWSGDQIAPAAVEDVQIFCRAEARDAGGKLQILTQGKEPTNFLDALGGVIITRRSNTVPYMLCGRRRTGRVVFDEVELSVESLCSGFPFIIVTTGGSLYLWKGRGANADEIGCARLTGMDLSVTGEIQETQEGSEPAELYNILDLELRKASPEYWSFKSSIDNYANRLFVVDADAKPRPGSSLTNLAVNIWRRRPSAASMTDPSEATVKEISPFAQSDLSEGEIFVLDTFFEIWILVGSQTRLKSNSFVLAVNFAQDYSMLSVSMQDRPRLPQSQIIFLGATGLIPAGIQTAFRKWDDRLIKQQNSWAPATAYMSVHDALEALESLK